MTFSKHISYYLAAAFSLAQLFFFDCILLNSGRKQASYCVRRNNILKKTDQTSENRG